MLIIPLNIIYQGSANIRRQLPKYLGVFILIILSNLLIINAQESVVVFSENFNSATITQPWAPYSTVGWFHGPPDNVLEEDAGHGQVLRVNFSQGDISSDAGFGNYYIPLDSSYKELYCSWEYFLPSNFDYGYGDGNGGGKFSISVAGGSSTAVPNNDDTDEDGWASILIFQNGDYFTYNYFKGTQYNEFGWPMGKRITDLVRGQWRRITIRAKVNDGDQANGIFEVFDNDVLVYQQTNAKMVNALHPDYLIEYLYLNMFFGGTSPCPVNQYIKYDNIVAFYYPPGSSGFRSGASESQRRINVPAAGSYHPLPPNVFRPANYTEANGTIRSHCGHYIPISVPDRFETSTIQVAGASSLTIDVTKFTFDKGATYTGSMQILNIYQGIGTSRTLVATYQKDNTPLQSYTLSGNSATIEWQSGQGMHGGFSLNYTSNGSGSGSNPECSNYFATQYSNNSSSIVNPPGNLQITSKTTNSINLRWTDNSSNETSFILQRMDENGNILLSLTLDPNTFQYVDEGLNSGSVYKYRVKAVNGTISSDFSNIVTVTTVQSLPPSPSELSVVETNVSSVTLSWIDNSSDETRFQLLRISEDGLLPQKLISVDPDHTQFIDHGLNSGTVFEYRIRAQNTSGYSDFSNSVFAETANDSIDPLLAPALNIKFISYDSIGLGWNEVVNASNYFVYRSENHSAYTIIDTVTGLSYIDHSILTEFLYQYYIIASGNNLVSEPSNSVDIHISATDLLLEAPRNVSLSEIRSRSLKLNWEDHSLNESGFILQRKDSEGSDFIFLDSLKANTTSYKDSLLDPDNQYIYSMKTYIEESISSEAVEKVAQTISIADESRVSENLIVFYNFNHVHNNTVHDLSGFEYALDLSLPETEADLMLQEKGAIKINAPLTIISDTFATKVAQTCGISDEFTVELWLNSSDNNVFPSTIISCGLNENNIGFELQQISSSTDGSVGTYQVLLHTKSTSSNGRPALEQEVNLRGNSLNHVVLTFSKDGEEKLYINNTLVAETFIVPDLSIWLDNYNLSIGNNFERTQPFYGSVYLFALYSAALNTDQINTNYMAGPSDGVFMDNPEISISIIPNPSSEKCVLEITKKQDQLFYFNNLFYSVFDNIGHTVHTGRIAYIDGQSEKTELDLSGLNPGVYILKVHSNNETLGHSKIVKLPH